MTPRDQRVLAIGAGIVIAALLGLKVLPRAVSSYHGAQVELEARRSLLARMREAVDRVEALSDSSEAVRQQFLALAPRLLSGDTEAAALASLTAHLSALADRSSTVLERADVVPDSARIADLDRVSVRASFEGDTRGITSVLRAIDVNAIALSTGAFRIVAPEPGSSARSPEVLKAEIVISGWYVGRGVK